MSMSLSLEQNVCIIFIILYKVYLFEASFKYMPLVQEHYQYVEAAATSTMPVMYVSEVEEDMLCIKSPITQPQSLQELELHRRQCYGSSARRCSNLQYFNLLYGCSNITSACRKALRQSHPRLRSKINLTKKKNKITFHV